MKLPRNRFSLLSALWFAAWHLFAALQSCRHRAAAVSTFRQSSTPCPVFRTNLASTKAFKTGKLPIPYRSLIAFAFCFAVGSECAQAWFTATRTGSLGDVLADLTGAALALFAARSACRPD